ncbi:uncharacterized protein LOC142758994 [Rhinoderma darwinii]|uniref:uncharacterized protein LOC142758994 n=1 Tax=Rhinoderma darwinii TaxID=43563 RepID=UPI003F672709
MSPVVSLLLLLALSYVSTVERYRPETELAEKPGTCPADVDYPTCQDSMIYKNECDIDQDCEGKSKCCYSGCRKRCLLPLEDKMNPCPYFNHSICIYARPLPPDCHTDNQCPGSDRCCCFNCRHQCTPTVKVKPGQCPAPKKKCPKILPEAECKTDSDCSDNKKCCDQCGQKCVSPEKEHAGVCPTSLENLSCINLEKTLCNRDSDCPLKQKCCLSGDTLQCLDVKNEKPGTCPIPVTRCKPPPPKPLCNSDQECPGDKKCCTPWCRKECTDV